MPATQKMPLVSVIMPAYNCEAYIAEALDSVLAQTYTNLEIIVVDDGSTDGTWKIIQDYAKKDKRLKPLQNKQNLNIAGTLNVAIAAAQGSLLARMDGDDVRLPDSIEKQVAFLATHPEHVMVGGAVEFCDIRMKFMNNRSYQETDEAIRGKLFRYSPFCHASLVIRAEAMDSVPYRINWAEDYDLYFRLLKKGKGANLPDVLYRVRTHSTSISRSKTRLQEKRTLFIRIKAVFEYEYKMSASDKLYFVAQLGTMYLMPPSLRFWLFNKLRAS